MPSRSVRGLWLVLLALLPALALHIIHRVDTPNTELEPLRIDAFRYVVSRAEQPPVREDWQAADRETWLDLPPRREAFNSIWVAIDPPFGGEVPDRLAVLMPSPEANVAVFYGSRFLGQSGAMERPLDFYLRPLYFNLPVSGSDWPADETLYIRLAREGGGLLRGDIFVGPADVLGAEHRRLRFYWLWVPAFVATLMLGLAVVLITLHVVNRLEQEYGLYAVIVVLWALHTIHGLIDTIPFWHWLWFSLPYLTLWWAILTPVFLNRFFDLRVRYLGTVLIRLGILLTLPIPTLVVLHEIGILYAYYAVVWTPFVLLCTVIVVGQCVYASWRDWSFETVGMYTLIVTGLVFGTRDYLFDFYDWVPGTNYYMQYIALVQIALFNLIIARRYARSANELVTLNRELEHRVQHKAQELEDSYEERRTLEVENTLSQERERLMRDMHDGLGGQLIQALAISESEAASDALRESLERALVDLRLIVDSIAPEHGDIVSLLASFRHRTRRVWENSGVDLAWEMGDVRATALGPERSLNVLRIVQEATTNALRHSGAGTIRVAVSGDRAHVRVQISDDGRGFDTAAATGGFGLSNMRRRAEQSGFDLDIDSNGGGTRVGLCIPLASDAG